MNFRTVNQVRTTGQLFTGPFPYRRLNEVSNLRDSNSSVQFPGLNLARITCSAHNPANLGFATPLRRKRQYSLGTAQGRIWNGRRRSKMQCRTREGVSKPPSCGCSNTANGRQGGCGSRVVTCKVRGRFTVQMQMRGAGCLSCSSGGVTVHWGRRDLSGNCQHKLMMAHEVRSRSRCRGLFVLWIVGYGCACHLEWERRVYQLVGKYLRFQIGDVSILDSTKQWLLSMHLRDRVVHFIHLNSKSVVQSRTITGPIKTKHSVSEASLGRVARIRPLTSPSCIPRAQNLVLRKRMFNLVLHLRPLSSTEVHNSSIGLPPN